MIWFRRIWPSSSWIKLVLIVFVQSNFMLCWSLNNEGIALLKFRERVVTDPFGALSSWNEEVGETAHCSWFGIECSDDGHVVSLNLKNLCLKGTLASELGILSHIKSIMLRNNSFFGTIPEEICKLKELELLDLCCNNLSQPLLPDFGYNIPILLLDSNDISCHLSPELREHMLLSEVQLRKKYLTGGEALHCTRYHGCPREAVHLHRQVLSRKLLAPSTPVEDPWLSPSPKSRTFHFPPAPILHEFASRPRPPAPLRHLAPPPTQNSSPPMPMPLAHVPPSLSKSSTLSIPNPKPNAPPTPAPSAGPAHLFPIIAVTVGGFAGLVVVIGIFLWQSNKITNVAPWGLGLSGQLQKAFVTGIDRSDGFYSGKRSFLEGIPSLKRSELETACEDFSNIIGPSSLGTIYKGTLSNGIEISVISLPVTSAKGWSRNFERQLRKKINTLSKVNHKNFISLIGYCEEKKPFTRMLVFEYAPNGSLFEHLHIKEAEHLDWGMRLRIIMGMAYCLEHMHQLTPPRTHPNLNSSSVNLSEDYAAKISDFCVWNEIAGSQVRPIGMEFLSPSSATPESNVYSFGLVLLEMMTGHVPHSLGNNSLENWVSGFLRGEELLEALVDPMLRRFNPEQLERMSDVIRKCLHPDRKQRPTMRDITARLKDITSIDRDKAGPRLSPLWWAELEICSVNGA